MNLNNIEILQKKGVNIPNPSTVFIGDDVDLERISPDGVTLFRHQVNRRPNPDYAGHRSWLRNAGDR